MSTYYYGDSKFVEEQKPKQDRSSAEILKDIHNRFGVPITPDYNAPEYCLLFFPDTGMVERGKFKPYRYYDPNRGYFVRTEFTIDRDRYQHIIDTIHAKIRGYGLSPDSTEVVKPINHFGQERSFLVARPTEHIIATFIKRTNTRIPFDEFIDRIVKCTDKRTFCYIKYLTSQWNPQEFVLSVERPVYRRDYTNTNKKTFDFIDVTEVIRSTDASKEKVKANKDEIFKKAISRIEKDRSFAKYGIPINYLKMYRCTVRHDGTVIISFCLKNIIGDKGEE